MMYKYDFNLLSRSKVTRTLTKYTQELYSKLYLIKFNLFTIMNTYPSLHYCKYGYDNQSVSLKNVYLYA